MAGLDDPAFGGKPLADEFVTQTPDPAALALPEPPAKVPVGEVAKGTQFDVQAQAAQAAWKPRSSVFSSFLSAAQLTDTAALLEAVALPAEREEQGYQNSVNFANLDFQPTIEEYQFLNKSKSDAGWGRREQRVRTLREHSRVAADHNITAGAVALFDPVYIGADIATLGLSRAVSTARAGRAITATAAGAAAGTISTVAGQATPKSDAEFYMNVFLNGAATAAVYKGGKLVPKDPDFPGAAATQSLDKFREDFVGPAPYGVGELTQVSTRQVVTPGTPAVPQVLEEVALPGSVPTGPSFLQSSKPNYGYRGENFSLEFEHPMDKAAYILGGKGKSAAHESILEWAKATSGLSEEKLVALGGIIRGKLKAEVKATGSIGRVGKTYSGELPGTVAPSKVMREVAPAQVAVPERVVMQVERDTIRYAKEKPDDILHPNAPPTSPAVVEAAVETKQKALAERLGEKLQWNMRKQMSSYGEVGDEVANLLYDNNSNLSRTSIESQHRAVRADLSALQSVYEDQLKQAMTQQGAGLFQRITSPIKARAKQVQIEQDVMTELLRRDQLHRQGVPITHEGIPAHIKNMADAHDALTSKALKELKAAGVEGAEQIMEQPGWFHRQWNASKIETMVSKFEAQGMAREAAETAVKRVVAGAIQKANGWDNILSYDVGASIVNRTLRKGYFEDAAFNMHQGTGTLNQMRDILREEGLSGQRLERALEVLSGKNAEAGKAPFLKHRVELDYTHEVALPDGSTVRVQELLDSDLATITDRYLDGVAAQASFARSGLRNASDIAELRGKLARSIEDTTKREEAVKLFDNSVNYMFGRPAGDQMNNTMRNVAAYGRTIALANSGLWQFTEYATIMAHYGMLRTAKYMAAEMPVFKSLMETAATDKAVSTQLKDILTRTSVQDLRMRPFLTKFEDNFEMSVGSGTQLALQQANQLVPYVNAMKYVHSHQARVTANLIIDRFQQAVKGNAKAVESLKKYGVESHIMDKLSADVKLHGLDTAKWSDGTWAAIRPAFAKMMDEGVLHARLGDMPAFAQFDSVGKFIFTYRSFVMAAHNKVLAGSLAREGFAGAGLLMLYQFPLAMMAVHAQAALSGKKLTESDLAHKAVGQMGGLGWFGELYSVLSGQKNQFGAPGLIPIDRMYGIASQVGNGDMAKAASGVSQIIPIASLIQPIKSFPALVKE